ncbi:tetratricopeptide repeat protein [Leptospira fletcheri]|uniref:Tetratricopeptide repeat protein n=1 Tax=Leptospira fletcheri TaxID=2484981 RepID=A0A4R9GIA0_9LEPT|nr:tetratricopeptide repeat protein [Leptospira fletcheri]TGK12339.1 tetratricopeptide repeat protein [Leptospira fletcheri]
MENPIRKNRIFLETEEPKTSAYYGEEPESFQPRRSYNKLAFFWAAMVLLILLAFLAAGWYYFSHRSGEIAGGGFPGSKDLLAPKGDISRLLERPYLPEGSANPQLTKCINLYKERFTRQAFDYCTEFLNGPSTEPEKSLALTVLGVIHDEAGRFPLAIERLQKAILYDPKNVHAYYNLTLAYKHNGQFADARSTAMKAKELAPDDPRIALLAGNLFNEINDPDAAIDSYKRGLSSAPDDPYLTYNLAVSYFKKGELPQAEEQFKLVVLKSRGGKLAALSNSYLGNIAYNRGELAAAEHYFREAANLSPNDAKALYNLSVVLKKNGKQEEALKYLELAKQAGASDPEIFRSIAESFEQLNQGEQSISTLQKGLKYNPNNLDLLFQLAETYYNRGDLLAAEETYRRIVDSTPGDSFTETALLNLGVVLDQMERYGEAVTYLNRLIEINPKNAKAYYNLGLVYKHTGNGVQTIENFRRAAYLDPSDIKPKEALGDYYLENKFYREAIEEYSVIVKQKEDNYKVALKLAEAYIGSNQSSNAEKVLLQVLNQSRNPAELQQAHKKLALLYNKSKDPDLRNRAKDEAYRSAHMNPEDYEGRLVLTKILLDSNSVLDREKAIEELTAIVRSEVRPKTASTAYNYLGVAYYKNGEYKKAVRSFQNSIDLDPSNTEAYDNKRAAAAALEGASVREGAF